MLKLDIRSRGKGSNVAADVQLKPWELEEIRYRLSIEEPRVIRRANILNCLHLGYPSEDIVQALSFAARNLGEWFFS